MWEASGKPLEASGKRPGSLEEAFGSFWEAFGQRLEASGKPLGSCWEASGKPLGSSWELLRSLWGGSGKILGSPRELLEPLGSFWEVSGKLLEERMVTSNRGVRGNHFIAHIADGLVRAPLAGRVGYVSPKALRAYARCSGPASHRKCAAAARRLYKPERLASV